DCGRISDCWQCLPGCVWAAFEKGTCGCLDEIGKATSDILAFRSGMADCQDFVGMFCQGPSPPNNTKAGSTNIGAKTIMFGVVVVVGLFFCWIFYDSLASLRARIRQGMTRNTLYVWAVAGRLWTRIRRRFAGRRRGEPRDWRVRYNEGVGRDPAAFFRDLVDLNVRMDPGHPPPNQSPEGHFIARTPRRPQPPLPPPAPPQPPPVMRIPPPALPLLPTAPSLPPTPPPLPPPAPPMPPPLPPLRKKPKPGVRGLPENFILLAPPPLIACPGQLPSESPDARVQPPRACKTTTPGYYRHTESWTRKVTPKKMSQDTWEPLENFDSSLVESILSFHHISLEYCRILSFGAVVPRTTYLYISILQELEQTTTAVLRQMMELQAVNTSPSVIPQSETAVGLIRMQDGVNVSTQTETSLTLDVSTQTLPQSLLYTRKKRSDAKDIPLKFICPYCDAKFGSKSILTRHVKILHLTASKNRIDTVLKQWKCTTCNKNYKTEKSLNSHNGNGKCKGIPKPRASKREKLK
ncbi:unnamed protein product, partial [Allacma fusca]